MAPAKATEVQAAHAPFTSRPDPFASMPPEVATATRGARCAEGLSNVCYDLRDRGIVYRGAREYMPQLQGLTAEGVALRRDRLILRYSFR